MEFADIVHQYLKDLGYNAHIQCGMHGLAGGNGRVVQLGPNWKDHIHIYLNDGDVFVNGHLNSLDAEYIIALVEFEAEMVSLDHFKRRKGDYSKPATERLRELREVYPKGYQKPLRGPKDRRFKPSEGSLFDVKVGSIHDQDVFDNLVRLIPRKYLKSSEKGKASND